MATQKKKKKQLLSLFFWGRSSPQKFKALKHYVINIAKKSEFEKSRVAYKEKGGKYEFPEITAKVKIKS